MMSEISATTVKKQQKSQKTFTSQTLSISFLTEYVNKTLCLKLICNNEKYVLIFKNTKNYHISLFDFHYYVMIDPKVIWDLHKVCISWDALAINNKTLI